MPTINVPVRAKTGYIEVDRLDKSGRKVKARQHVVGSEGMHTAAEMERIMRQVAEDVGASEEQIRIETFQQGEAPIEANPRHRGPARRKYWAGWSPPGR